MNTYTEPGKMEHPRILYVAAQTLRANSAAGITVANLLQGYPADCIQQIHADSVEPDPQLCSKAWKLGLKDVPGDQILRPLLGRCGLVAGRGDGSAIRPPAQSSSPGWKRTLRPVLRAHADLVPFQIKPELEKWVRDFNPHLIFSLLGNIRTTRLALGVSRLLNRPLLAYFMDDWMSTHYTELASWIPRQILLRNVRKAIKSSPVVLCISEAMAEEYQTRFNCSCRAFVNCCELGEYVPPGSKPDGKIRFTYVGGLHLDRWRSLMELGDVIARVSANGGPQCTLVIHAPNSDLDQYGPLLRKSPGITVERSLAPQEVPGALREADVLVHVESFLPGFVNYCRLSISTKIPQYMTSGRPALCYGPGILASNRYFLAHDAGLVVGERDPDALMKAVIRLCEDRDLRVRLGQNGRKIAVARHDAVRQRKAFRETLVEVASGNH